MITVRCATTRDIDTVLRVWRDATTASPTDDADAMQVLLHADARALLVAIDDDELVGTVIAGWDGWRGTMYRLAVLSSHRRRGIATALVAHAERRLREQGARRLHMIVDAEEAPARAFWAAAGYTATDQLRFVKTV